MSPSIAYDARVGVGEVRDDNIIMFSDRIYTRLGQCCYLEDSDDFPKKHLTILRIVKSFELILMDNAPVFAYLFQTTCLSNFTLLNKFSNL